MQTALAMTVARPNPSKLTRTDVSPGDRRRSRRETIGARITRFAPAPAVGLAIVASATPAAADAYCDHVTSVAEAESASLLSPSLFASVGYLKQPEDGQSAFAAGRRLTAGISYRFDGIIESRARKERAQATCRLHRAEQAIESLPRTRALEARVKVLADAMSLASKVLDDVTKEYNERLATAQDVTALQLRLEKLQRMSADARRELAAVDPLQTNHSGQVPVTLAAVRAAARDVEEADAELRIVDAIKLSVRAGYDRYLDVEDDTPYFAMMTVDINLGALAQSGANKRAMSARDRIFVESSPAVDALIAVENERASKTAALIVDLTAQIESLEQVAGSDGKRQRRALWFDLVELRAEHASANARVIALREVYGGGR